MNNRKNNENNPNEPEEPYLIPSYWISKESKYLESYFNFLLKKMIGFDIKHAGLTF
jgi:hypothetical protein